MPTIQYPNNPNTETAFVEQDDGTRNRALLTAPQDISTIEYPNNPNSTKAYVTINGKKQRVVMTATIAGGGSALPDQTGNTGKFLTTDGTDASWGDPLPSQTGNTGKFLTTNGTDASWGNALANTATGTDSLSILGTATTRDESVNIGVSSNANGHYSVAIGKNAQVYNSRAIAIGINTYVGNDSGIAIGANMKANALNAIQIGGALPANSQNNTDAHTVKIYNGNGNFELMSADGTVPTARLTKVSTTVTLAAADWSSNTQTVNVTGMTATGLVLVSPDPTDQADYTSAGIICSAQAAGSLEFTCDTTPANDIDVVVVML